MSGHASTAAAVRKRKELHPELYCQDRRCLWFTASGKPCPKHPVKEPPTFLLPCPFCGGEGLPQKDLRDGYEEFRDDQDAYCYYVRCRNCAATSGWSKASARGGARWWNMRQKSEERGYTAPPPVAQKTPP